MSQSLRSLTGKVGRTTCVFYVFNTSTDTESNGGACCCVIIPAGFTAATVELWGGGATGGGACCCMWPYSQATPGSYVSSRFPVVAGEFYTVCAAGSTGCSAACCGIGGNPSFIARNGASMCACAHGGLAGCTLCFFKSFNCTGICVPSEIHIAANVGCLSVCGARGTSQTSNFCATDMLETTMGSPKFAQNSRLGHDHCCSQFTQSGCCRLRNHWPGGPGNGAGACGGGCCWSGWGAGGLVIMTIYG